MLKVWTTGWQKTADLMLSTIFAFLFYCGLIWNVRSAARLGCFLVRGRVDRVSRRQVFKTGVYVGRTRLSIRARYLGSGDLKRALRVHKRQIGITRLPRNYSLVHGHYWLEAVIFPRSVGA